jgi:dipeptidyl aminopeptidase/acylaminoacyl peptidase
LGKYGASWRIYSLEVASGDSVELLPDDQSQQADPDWSNDGTKLVFGQNPAPSTEIGRQRYLSIYDLPTRHAEPLAGSANLHSPRWSPDGHYIVAILARTQILRLYDTRSSEWFDLTGPNPTGTGYPSWTSDSKRVFFLTNEKSENGGTENIIMSVDVKTRRSARFGSLAKIRQSPLTFGTWIGLDLQDTPIAIRDLTKPTIEAFDWLVK